jgi:hypothetical protein
MVFGYALVVAVIPYAIWRGLKRFNSTLLYRQRQRGRYIARAALPGKSMEKPCYIKAKMQVDLIVGCLGAIPLTLMFTAGLPYRHIFTGVFAIPVVLTMTYVACRFLHHQLTYKVANAKYTGASAIPDSGPGSPGWLSDVRNLSGTTNPASPNSIPMPYSNDLR